MTILRAFLALVAGFISMALIVGVITGVLMKRAPAWVGTTGSPSTSYILVNLAYSFLAAMIGGYITTWIAKQQPLIHILALAIIVLLLGGLSALQQRGLQPLWYQLSLLVLMPIAVLCGGLLRLRMTGLI